jgi:putative spermidine/putrescine transport system permease protein
VQVLTRVIIPNIRGAIISASVISVALVLGEFTIASLLNFDTLQVVINLLGKRDAALAVAVSVAALLFAFVLLLVLAYVAPRRAGRPVAVESTVEGSRS